MYCSNRPGGSEDTKADAIFSNYKGLSSIIKSINDRMIKIDKRLMGKD
jgi:hypothetical protein